MSKLQSLLRPRSIALIGASRNFNKINGRPLKFLLEKGYAGRIYPINPSYDAIGELPCYPDVASVPGEIDLAVVMVPAKAAVESLRALVAKGVPAAVVFSSGFSETGEAGAELEAEVRSIVEESGLLLCGPNTLGLLNSFERVMANFSQYASAETPEGPVGFVTQSGAFGTAIAALARERGLGLGYFINTGNEAGVGFPDVMEDVLADERIRVGAGYLEGLVDGPGFVALAERALDADKPLVVAKVGRTAAGARAAASHTGSLAGEDAVFTGVCRQYGVVRLPDEEQMLDALEAFTSGVRVSGRRVGLVSQSGGAGVLMADRAEELGLDVTPLGEETNRRLREVVPAFGALANPVDITAQFVAQPEIFRDSVKAVLADPNVDFGVVWFQLMHEFVDTLREVFADIRAAIDKPLLVCWVAGPKEGIDAVRELGFPVFRSASAALTAADAAVRYGDMRQRRLAARRDAVPLPQPSSLLQGKGAVPATVARDLLAEAGVQLVPSRLCTDAAQLDSAASELGYPLVVKVESPDIGHKSDIGGVRLGISDAAALSAAHDEVRNAARRAYPDAEIQGVLLQSMATEAAVEMVIGLKRDPAFGMVIMLGFGGTELEVVPDVTFRQCPVSEGEAEDMLDNLRGAALLGPVRGRPAVDRGALARLVAAVSRFGAANADRVSELDINPVRASASGALAVDWLLVSEPADAEGE